MNSAPATSIEAQSVDGAMVLSKDLISIYVSQLPAGIREYLRVQRGLTPEVIWRMQLGWNGSRITIPIFDRKHKLAFFKLARSPGASQDEPKMVCWPAGQRGAELYGWEHLKQPPSSSKLVICEGEFDRLVLESHGIPAVSGTAGALVFLDSWVTALAKIPSLFVCFDRDEAGEMGARKVTSALPHARIVELPDEVGGSGDVSDFFVRLKHGVREFRMLLTDAKPLPESERVQLQVRSLSILPNPKRRRRENPRLADLKAQVPIEVIVRDYIRDLRPSGRTLVGKCIFHADSTPSLVLYPDDGRFHCYGCGTHGDVIQFLMNAECWSFPKALRALEKYLRSLEP